jgi:hypothetical protein
MKIYRDKAKVLAFKGGRGFRIKIGVNERTLEEASTF